ncbi:MAG: P1 family peptidase [Anaerolineales bacterium]|jgi:L-aminopeptidase/D-esterase-like protein
MNSLSNTLTDIPGLLVGHAQDAAALTGCTVILCPQGAVGGVDQRGGAPGTRETDLLHPMHLVNQVHGVLLTGGSAFGLDAAAGVMRWLEEQNIGFDVGVSRVPIVPAAVIFDLDVGSAQVRPDAAMGYLACQQATDTPVPVGNIGAGTGATVGKVLGPTQATRGGLGCATIQAGDWLRVSALMVVNVLGEVVDPATGQIVAGARAPQAQAGQPVFVPTLEVLKQLANQPNPSAGAGSTNTVVGVVATNARLSKEEINKVAQMAQDGLARAIRPAHTMYDGDTIFALSTGNQTADVSLVGALAAEAVAGAILNAVLSADPAGGLPAAKDVNP